MTNARTKPVEDLTYPLGATSRLTGLSPDILRAWERRYGVVEPLRTPGGTRRYRASDLERLRMVKAAVDAGYRISEVATLDAEELASRASAPAEPSADPLEATMRALEQLDGEEAERIIGLQLAALGPLQFAKLFAVPLLEEIGRGWIAQQIGIASEHLASGVLRSMLGASLRTPPAAAHAAPIVFTTLPGERHELGLLIAALTAVGAGGRPVYLGPDMPIGDLVEAVSISKAGAIALSVVSMQARHAEPLLEELRAALPDAIELWVGGEGSRVLDVPAGVSLLGSLDTLEQRVGLLNVRLGGGQS